LGRKPKSLLTGSVSADDLTVSIVKDRLQKPDCSKGFLLDGFPRTIPQAERLDEVLRDMGMELDAVINLDVPDEVIVRRMAGRRVCRNCGMAYHIVTKPSEIRRQV